MNCGEKQLIKFFIFFLFFTGSLTDSICTAYENKNVKSTGTPSKIPIAKITNDCDQNSGNGSEKDSAYTPVGNLTSMLDGKK